MEGGDIDDVHIRMVEVEVKALDGARVGHISTALPFFLLLLLLPYTRRQADRQLVG